MRFVKSTRAYSLLVVSMSGTLHAHAAEGVGEAVPADYAAMWLLAAVIASGLYFSYPRLRAVFGRIRQKFFARTDSPEQATFTDSLTGMQNRRYFDEALKEYLVQFDRIQRPVGLMVIDLDHLGEVNQAHGRDGGDRVLREVAHCLRSFTRQHDVVARLDGAEFAVLAPNMDEERMTKFANRIREAVSALEIDLGEVTVHVTVSIGLTVWDNQETSNEFYRRAAGMLASAKRMGRNRVLSDLASAGQRLK